MSVLDAIIKRKISEVAESKGILLDTNLEKTANFTRPTLSLRKFLLDRSKSGIIAEFKRISPSKGILHRTAKPEIVSKGYAEGGASGISVLTDEPFFGGFKTDLTACRFNEVPILRKDFILDEHQIVESRSIGADVILLIAACCTPARVRELAAFAHTLNLEVLLEITNERELGHMCDDVDILGVNNRDLKSFKTDITRSIELSKLIPTDVVKISESGLKDIRAVRRLTQYGFNGFLMGEVFMTQPDPAIAFQNFVKQLKENQDEN